MPNIRLLIRLKVLMTPEKVIVENQCKFAIVIPAMNEAQSISRVIDSIRRCVSCPIIVVDDASGDETSKIAISSGAIVLPHVINMGAWRATQTGIRYCLKRDFDYVITFDADGQHQADSILPLLFKAKAGNDLVIGSCVSRGSLGRRIAWRIFKKITGLKINDLTSGLRCYSHAAMQVMASREATMLEYQDVGVLLMIRNMHMSHAEIQVEMNGREHGISRIFHSWLAVSNYLLYTVVLSLSKAIPESYASSKRKFSRSRFD